MNELALSKKQRTKKNAGGGSKNLPLRRKYERERIEQITRGGKEMTEWHRQRIAAMDAEIEQQNATKEGTVKEMHESMDALSRKWDADDQRLSAERDARIAGEIDAKAQQLMGSDPTLDYSTATRMALAGDERFAGTADAADQDTDLASAVERRMKASPEHYGDEGDGPVGSVHAMSDAEYQSQVKEAMQARGYDVD